MRLDHILITTDFSEAARIGYDHGLALADQLGAAVTLLHVVELSEYSLQPILARELGESAVMADVEKRFVKERELFGTHKIETVTRVGHPTEQILEFVEYHGVDLIVAARHGHHGLRRLLPGSTTRRLVRHAKVPLLIVPADEKVGPPANGYRHLLTGTDFSEDSRLGLRVCLDLARELEARTTVVHVVRIPPMIHASSPPAEKEVQELEDHGRGRLHDEAKGVATEALEEMAVVDTDPARGLVFAAESTNAELIVLPSHGKGLFRAVLVGSTTERVMQISPLPLLILPRRPDQGGHS